MIGNNKVRATEGSQVVRVHSGGGSPTSFLTRTTCFSFFRTQPCIEPRHPRTLYPDDVIRNTIGHVGHPIYVVNEVLFIYHSLLTLHIYAIYKMDNMHIRYIQYILHIRYIIHIIDVSFFPFFFFKDPTLK